jgi:hypothetical protein
MKAFPLFKNPARFHSKISTSSDFTPKRKPS